MAPGRQGFDYPLQVSENCSSSIVHFLSRGPVAQLGARFHGMEEVVGSIPTRSTIGSILRNPSVAIRR
jgi:hypothetical protein